MNQLSHCIMESDRIASNVWTSSHPVDRSREAAARSQVGAFIRKAYASSFGANLKSLMPNFAIHKNASGQINAAFGYADAGYDAVFLESYLGRPVAEVIKGRLGLSVRPEKIVEVGNLVIPKQLNSICALRSIAYYLSQQGYQWIVCTATRYLRMLFLTSGVKPFSLGAVSIEQVKTDGTDWGSYYDTVPEILLGNVAQCLSLIDHKLAQKGLLKRYLANPINFQGV